MVSRSIIIVITVSLQISVSYCVPLPIQNGNLGDDSLAVHADHYVNYDDLSFSKESGVFETTPEDTPAIADQNDQPSTLHLIVKRSDVQEPELLQPIALLVPSGGQFEDDAGDMEVAESHLFKPVFRYKSQYTERRRIRQLPAQFGALVVQ